MSAGRGRRALVATGVVVLIVGLVGAVAFWIGADERLDSAIRGLARAPVGCDTVLDFDSGGNYVLFAETSGSIDDVRGDCDLSGDFEWDGADGEIPSAVLTLSDPDGDDVTLERETSLSYDSDGSIGTSVRSVTIGDGGEHTLRVESDDGRFVIAVGRDPQNGVRAMRLASWSCAALGLVVGGVLLVSGARRGEHGADDRTDWVPPPPTTGWPSSPPGFPEPPRTTGATGAVGPPVPPTRSLPTVPLPSPPARDTPDPATPALGPPTADRWAPPSTKQ